MILTNTNPHSVWNTAMGADAVRFPPGSWEKGGGGYMGYGYMIDAPNLPRWRSPTPRMGFMIDAPALPRYTVPWAGYGLAAGSGTDLVMADVIDALSRALASLNAEALARSDLAVDQKAQAIASLIPAEAQLEGLATSGRQAVLHGTMSIDTWLAQAQMVSDRLQGPASVIDPQTGAWISGVIADARGTSLQSQWPVWVIVLGVAGAALIGYKLLKK
jgi:hypothetical protein